MALFVLFFIQGIFPFFPYFILAGAAGMIFGKYEGTALAFGGALAGALFLFFMTKMLVGSRFANLVKDRFAIDLEGLDDKNVFLILLTARLVPVVPTPLINIGSALSKVKNSIYFISSCIGKLVWAVVYVFLGDYFIRTHNLFNALAGLAAVIIIAIIAGKYYFNRISVNRFKFPNKKSI